MKDLLRTADLTADDFRLLLDLAAEFKRVPHRQKDFLQNESVVLYFNKPSTRTRISFETAVARLGGTPVSVGAQDLQMGRGETIEDTARVMSGYAKAFVIRTFSDEDVRRFAAAASIPVVNALTDGHHPCQSVADMLTLREQKGRLEGLKIAYLGDGNNVAHSLVEAAALCGCPISVATPESHRPDPDVIELARGLGDAEITVTGDPAEAVRDADAVYTDVWLSMGDREEERTARLQALSPFRVDEALMARARPDAIFLHCLPAHRGEEVVAEVMDGPRSAVFSQAENRLHTAVAILHALLERRLRGA